MNEAPATAAKRILIVDDQPENIHVLIENLESDYDILFATNGSKALEIAFSENRPDLILLDIMMPGLSGYEVCRKLKDHDGTRNIPVIFITSQTEEADEAEGFSLGATDYIPKPFRIPIVKARIQSVLRLKEEMDNRVLLAGKLEDLNRNLEQRVHDKTQELLLAHERLKVSEQKFRTIFKNAIEGIFQTTPDGRLLEVSPSFAQILGYDSPLRLMADLSNAIDLYVNPADRAEFKRLLEAKGEISGYETRFIRKDESTISVTLSAKTICNDRNEILYYQGFVIDITEQKRAKDLELANIRLRELDSLKSALMSTASHDMRSPMTAILGFNELTQLLFSDHFLPICRGDETLEAVAEEIMGRFDIIDKEGKRLIRMVNDFLDLSKVESGYTRWNDGPVQVNDIGAQAMQVVRGQIENQKALCLETVLEPNLPLVTCDPDRLMQVMVNLISNAIKFTGRGCVRLTTETISRHRIEVRVKDTGPGIPEAEQQRIFDKFHQVQQQTGTGKDPPGGSGLGLAICKQIVEHYGGRIWVESTLGVGSTFIFQLPVAIETGSNRKAAV